MKDRYQKMDTEVVSTSHYSLGSR
jgi:hypothetical protein